MPMQKSKLNGNLVSKESHIVYDLRVGIPLLGTSEKIRKGSLTAVHKAWLGWGRVTKCWLALVIQCLPMSQSQFPPCL